MSHRRSIVSRASEDRLEKLIAARLQPGADREHIDRRIWDLFGEEWSIMFTDLAGFSRGVARFGIIHFLQTMYESERLLIPEIEKHDGIMLKVEGDSFLVIFRNVHKAIRAAVDMQRALHDYNRNKPAEDKVLLCVGLGFGEVLRIGDTDVFGEEVNAASKLGEDVANAQEILVTDAVREAAKALDDVAFEDLGDLPWGGGRAWRMRYALE